MKILLTTLLLFLIAIYVNADDDKYREAMQRNLEKIQTAESADQFVAIANSFERIALAEKDKWLPFYYTAMMYTLAGFTDSLNVKKDAYLDKADNFIEIADSLKPDNSEIFTMKGMIAQGRLQIDPMNRWMKYGTLSNNMFLKATELDSLNPRPDYLTGIGIYYTPEQFGGGSKAAKPILERSLEKFNKFEPESELMPDWGREMVEELLNQINKPSESSDAEELEEEIKEE